MHSNTIMNQLLLLLPRHQFDQAVSGFGGDAYVKKFSTWNQLTTLLYAQASAKTSLRDIQTALGTQQPKLYHLGLPPVKRSTLRRAPRRAAAVIAPFKRPGKHPRIRGPPKAASFRIPWNSPRPNTVPTAAECV